MLGILGGWIGITDLSLQLILGYIFFPIVWLMGVPLSETLASAELLGLKTALNELKNAYNKASHARSKCGSNQRFD